MCCTDPRSVCSGSSADVKHGVQELQTFLSGRGVLCRHKRASVVSREQAAVWLNTLHKWCHCQPMGECGAGVRRGAVRGRIYEFIRGKRWCLIRMLRVAVDGERPSRGRCELWRDAKEWKSCRHGYNEFSSQWKENCEKRTVAPGCRLYRSVELLFTAITSESICPLLSALCCSSDFKRPVKCRAETSRDHSYQYWYELVMARNLLSGALLPGNINIMDFLSGVPADLQGSSGESRRWWDRLIWPRMPERQGSHMTFNIAAIKMNLWVNHLGHSPPPPSVYLVLGST